MAKTGASNSGGAGVSVTLKKGYKVQHESGDTTFDELNVADKRYQESNV